MKPILKSIAILILAVALAVQHTFFTANSNAHLRLEAALREAARELSMLTYVEGQIDGIKFGRGEISWDEMALSKSNHFASVFQQTEK